MPHRLSFGRRLGLPALLVLLTACATPEGPYIPWSDPALDRVPQKTVTIRYRDWEADRGAIFAMLAETCPPDTEILWIDPGRLAGTALHPNELSARCLTQAEYRTATRDPAIRDAVIFDWPVE